MPEARLKVAKLLVVHLIHLAIHLESDVVRVAMVGGNIVADDVSQWPVDEMHIVSRKEVAGPLQLGPILQFKGNVMQLRLLVVNEIDRMMIDTAPHEDEEVAPPIGNSEAENALVKLRNERNIVDPVGDVPEFVRHDAVLEIVRRRELVSREHFYFSAFGSWNTRQFPTPGVISLRYSLETPSLLSVRANSLRSSARPTWKETRLRCPLTWL